MNTIKTKKIAIVGGGPGGLTLARLLQMNGAKVKVYERDEHKDARAKGATLDLHEESGLKALQEAGLIDTFWENYRPGADKLRIIDKHANIVFDDDADGRDGSTRPEIDRGPLQNILLDSLQSDTVVWNSHLLSISKLNEGWALEFKNNDSVYADIVIGADGANSRIRKYITPIQPFYSGVTAIEGAVHDSAKAVPRLHALLNGGKIFALSDNKTLLISSKGDGSLVFYPGFNTNENWSKESGIDFSNKAQVAEWFMKEYAGWDSIWLELFENASISFVARPQYCMPLDQSWETLPNITMLGDAAHLMPPYAGEGVNMAMLDALELSQCLLNEEFKDTHSSISAYEKQMLKRASEVAGITMDSTVALHGPNAISWMIQVIS